MTERDLKRALKKAGAGELKRLDLLASRIESPDEILAALSTIEIRQTHLLVATRTDFYVVSAGGITSIPYGEITEFEYREKFPSTKLIIHGPAGDPSFVVTGKGKAFAQTLNANLPDLQVAAADPPHALQTAAASLSEERRREIEAEERYRAELRKNLDPRGTPERASVKAEPAKAKNDKPGCRQGCLSAIVLAVLIAITLNIWGADSSDDATTASPSANPNQEERSSGPEGEYQSGYVVHIDAVTGRSWWGPENDRTPLWERNTPAPATPAQPAAAPPPSTYSSPTGRPVPPAGEHVRATPEYVVNFIANELEVTDIPCPVQLFDPMVCASTSDSRDLIAMTVNSAFELYLQPSSRNMGWQVDPQSGSYVAGFVRPEGVYAVSVYGGTVSIGYLGRQQ